MLIWLNSPRAHTRKFILLDRDGVINQNSPYYIKNIREFHTYPDALEALSILNRKEVSVILCSNQSGINRGLIPWTDFWEMHDGSVSQIRKGGGDVLAALYCPHRPDENCNCRKPSPNMLLTACRLFKIPPRDTYFIGDHDTDIQAALNAGIKGIRIWRVDQADNRPNLGGDIPVFPTFLDAVTSIYG